MALTGGKGLKSVFDVSNNYILFYRHFSARKLQRIKDNYTFLPRTHREMLPNFKDHIKKIMQCIEENQNFLNRIVSHTGEMFENRDHTGVPMVSPNNDIISHHFERGTVYH